MFFETPRHSGHPRGAVPAIERVKTTRPVRDKFLFILAHHLWKLKLALGVCQTVFAVASR